MAQDRRACGRACATYIGATGVCSTAGEVAGRRPTQAVAPTGMPAGPETERGTKMAGVPAGPGTHRPGRALLAALLVILLSACGQTPTTEEVARTSPMPVPLHTRNEASASAPCGPLWPEGEEVVLRGFYRVAGQPYVDVLRMQPDGPPCWARFFLDRDLGLPVSSWEDPSYVQVTGRPFSGRWSYSGLWDLQVIRWSSLSWDAGAARRACRQSVAGQAAELQEVDWAALATPAYVTGTVGFRPSGEGLTSAQVNLVGVDDRRPLLVMSVRGPDLPEVRPLVHRWIAVECWYDLEQQRVVELIATIRGEVQE